MFSRNSLKLLVVTLTVAMLCGGVYAKKDDPNNPNPEKPQKEKDRSKNQNQFNGSPGNSDSQNKQPKLSGEQRWMSQIKEQIQANDDEWSVLAPRVERVMKAQREVQAGHDPRGVREPRPPKEPRPDEPSRPVSVVSETAKALSATLWDQSSAASEIRRQVMAIRDARARARRELTQAQEELRQLLTYRQEAVLIIMGLLD
jgi:hypothetical protein